MGSSSTLAGANGSASGRISAQAAPELVVPRSMPTTYRAGLVGLLNFNFRGGDNGGVLLRRQARQVHLGGAPSLVPEGSAGRRFGRNVAHEFHQVRVLPGRLGVRALHAVDDRGQRDVAGDGIAALIVKLAHRGADLVVGVGGDVLHQEVDQAGVTLQNAQNLERAVRGASR